RLQIKLTCPAALDFRTSGKRGISGAQSLARIATGAVDQPAGQALRVVQQDLQQMFGCKLLVPFPKRQRLGGLHEAAGAVREFLTVHSSTPSACPSRPEGASRTIVIGFPVASMICAKAGSPGPQGARPPGYGNPHGAVKGFSPFFMDGLRLRGLSLTRPAHG